MWGKPRSIANKIPFCILPVRLALVTRANSAMFTPDAKISRPQQQIDHTVFAHGDRLTNMTREM